MTIRDTLATAVRSATLSGRLLVFLYLFNVLFATTVTLAFRVTVGNAMGNSMSYEALLRDFDFTVFDDFMHYFGDRIAPLAAAAGFLYLLYTLFGVFFGGGILALLHGDRRFEMAFFFEQCGTYFFRFLRIFFLLALVSLVVGGVLGAILLVIYTAATSDPTSEQTYVVWGVSLLLVFIMVQLILVMIADYARVDTFVNDHSKMRKVFWNATRFVFRNFGKTFGLQVALLVVAALIVSAYLLVEHEVGMISPSTILFMFLIQQATVLGKIWTRVATFGGQLALFKGLTEPRAVEVPPALPVATTVQPPAPEVPSPLVPESKPRAAAKRKTARRRVAAPKRRTRRKSP